MEYFTVRKKSNNTGNELPKDLADRLKERGFEESENYFRIPIGELTKKQHSLPMAS